MLPQVITVILFSTLILQTNCVPVKRSIFDIAPFEVRFSPNVQMGNPNTKYSNTPLFSIPDIQAPFQLASNIFNVDNKNIMPRRYDDASENSLNGRVHMNVKVNTNFNQANAEHGKDHTFKVTTIKPATTTLLGKNESIWKNKLNDNDVLTTPSTDNEVDGFITTESTTEFETTTDDDLLNRMAIPSSVLASLAG